MTGDLPATPKHNIIVKLLSCVLIVVGMLVYANSINTPFIFDDTAHIVTNRRIRSLDTLPELLSNTTRPVMKLTLAANYAISQLNVTSWHVVNITIHILAAMTLFGVVRRTLLTDLLRDRYAAVAPWMAFAIAIIWLVHPLQTQSVTYIIQRNESLMALFYLLTLYCAIRCATGQHQYRWAMAAIVSCELGMGTKEVMVSVPIVMLIYDRTFLSKSLKETLQQRWGLYVGLAATWVPLFILISMQGLFKEGSAAGFAVETVSVKQYVLSQPGVILHYLRLAIWPHPLCLDYGWKPAETFVDIVPPAIMILVLLSGSAWTLRRWSPVGFLGACFFLILAPTSTIMPIADLAVEHRMYLPLAAIITLIVILIDHRLRCKISLRPLISGSLVLVTTLVLIAATVARNHTYQSDLTLWESVLKVAPDNPRAHCSVAAIFQREGNYEMAIEYYKQALSIEINYYEALHNLGSALVELGHYDEAIGYYERALSYVPFFNRSGYKLGITVLFRNIGIVLERKDNLREAIGFYQKAVQFKPDHFGSRISLASALMAGENPTDAARHFNEAIQLEPQSIRANYGLGQALRQIGKFDEAVFPLRRALELKQESVEILFTLANTLRKIGQVDDAIVHYQKAVSIDPDDLETRNNLGTALAAQERFDEAIDQLNEALRIDPNSVEAHFNLGWALKMAGQPDEARSHFEVAIRFKPELKEVLAPSP